MGTVAEGTEAGSSAPGPGIVRIYVGGVGAGVTVADVEKAFSGLGRVIDVELVRTKDRSFAFMDFHPNSDKALAKLFSTYNGCTWKGGRLKVEKAKEHYLPRLKREWAEDAKLSMEKSDTCKETKISDQENMQLRIFFPKLKKVKSLPFKGTGKHKYSFQRIEVPTLPIHFCDCEEHCRPTEIASREFFSSHRNEVYEREQCTINSVVNNMTDMDDKEKASDGRINSAKEGNLDNLFVDDAMLGETEEANVTDADNLVTNIGVGASDVTWDIIQLKGGKTLSMGQQLLRFSKVQHLKDGDARDETDSQKRQKTESSASELSLNKKTHQVFLNKITKDESTAILQSLEISEGHSQEVERSTAAQSVESQTGASRSTVQSTKGQSWFQKSSWKDLVGETGNKSFSISHVFPGVDAVASELPGSNDLAFSSATIKKKTAQLDGEGSKSLRVKQNIIVAPALLEISEKGGRVQTNLEEGMHRTAPRKGNLETKRSIPEVEIGEVCTFMRNADSEKEWAKTKAALSGYLKKKSSGTRCF